MTRVWRHQVRPAALALVALAGLLVSTLGSGVATARHQAAGPVRGGTIRVGYSGRLPTLDPAQTYGDEWWLQNATGFNGLYQFDRYGQPQLDLAAAPPTISADHKVWTFKLRTGVLFHNGTELTADDVVFSLTRILEPHLKPTVSWGQTAETIFAGSREFIAGKASSVSGIQAVNRYTVRLTLLQPLAILPFILGESFNSIVPKAVVTKESADAFAHNPVGTGPFMLQSWDQARHVITFVRNPHYFHPGKPYLDKIIAYGNLSSSLMALKVEKGDLDGFGNDGEVAAPDIAQARKDATYKHYLVDGPTTWVEWIDLNTHVAPLDNLKVRQAIAMAINRPRWVRTNPLTIPAYQMHVPIDPQYDPTLAQHPVYPYDPQKAAAPLKASGYHGQPVTIMYGTGSNLHIPLLLQQDLTAIGLNAVLRGAPSASLSTIFNGLTGHQISATNWSVDYPDAYDIYTGQMACGTNGDGGVSSAHYCDTAADALVAKAQTLALGPERNALLRQADVRILQSASKIPYDYAKGIEIVSPKVGGFYYQPQFGWQFENYWLNP